MQTYINQLIEDLERVAHDPPAPPYIEPPPHMAETPDLAELALSPFKTIEELTGISEEVFPMEYQLSSDQIKQVIEAIFKVFAALNIEVVDIPEGIPPEQLYFALTFSWDEYVQHLPTAGMDLELCSGDPQTCVYGEYCDCFEGFDEEIE